ncbi:MAG: GAF domain-containing protein [Anaerolineae bacterium]
MANPETSEKRLEQQTRQLQALRQVGLEIVAQLDLEALLHSIVAHAIELLDARAGGFYLYHPEEDVLEWTVALGPGLAPVGVILHRGEGLSGKVLDEGRVLLVDDYEEWDGRAACYDEYEFSATMAVPVRWGGAEGKGEFLGVLDVLDEPPRTFTPADSELLSLFAAQVAIAIKNARLFDAERRSRERVERTAAELAVRERNFRLLNDITQAALRTPDVPTMLQTLADRLGELLEADGCHIALWDAQQGRPIPAAAYGPMRHVYRQFQPEPGEQTMTEAVLAAGRPLVADDVSRTPFVSERIADEFSVGAALGLPLIAAGEKLGAALIIYARPHCFTEEEVAWGEHAAGQIALAVAKARLLESEQQRRREAEALRHACLVVGSSLDPDVVLGQLLDQIGRVVTYDGANVMWIEGGQAHVIQQRGYERVGTAAATAALRLSVVETPNLGRLYETRRPHVISDTWAAEGWLPLEPTRWIRSWMGAPIIVRGDVVAFLCLDSETPGFYTGEHAELLAAFAAHAAVAIENARLFAEAQRAYEELKQAQAQLIHSANMAAVGELAAGVAHELNNPLTSVLGYAELLAWRRKDGLAPDIEADDPILSDLAVIADEARRARDIVRSLLDFAGQSQAVPEDAELNKTVRAALGLLRSRMEQAGVAVVEDYGLDLPRLPLAVGRVQQVFLNLFSNALQSMPQGGTLTVCSRRAEGGLVVDVIDSGEGIAEENLLRIFEPFFTTRPVGAGTGLGLSVSLGIVQAHGGRIEVESQPGRGSTFRVWLPLREEMGEMGNDG